MTEFRNNKKSNTKTVKIAFCGLFTALAVIMGYIESFIYIPGLLPGMKIGLANAVVIYVLYVFGLRYSIYVSLIRIVIINMMFGNLTWAMYSIAGALLSLIGMSLLKKINRFSVIGVSMTGGVFHNLGQTIVAMILFENVGMISYFPFLLVFGTFAGLFIGIISGIVIKKLSCKHLFEVVE